MSIIQALMGFKPGLVDHYSIQENRRVAECLVEELRCESKRLAQDPTISSKI